LTARRTVGALELRLAVSALRHEAVIPSSIRLKGRESTATLGRVPLVRPNAGRRSV
jgi:hypothetical protein